MRASLSSSMSSSTASRYTSTKWIQNFQKKEGGQELKTEDISSIFREVEKKPCNLISIFGRARQGKSFLMNVLANENDIFRVSNEKESCTQGIDISNKWLSVAEFSRIDRGNGARSDNQVGFVDAEGQGDKDVAYDANLVCPILLTSKCVIFNWKGDLQKDHMLNTLGIMARAAENVDVESSGSASRGKKFGHLHICFRDWQAVGSSRSDVFKQLFDEERCTEANTRDKIRRDVKACFETINVWLFDAPVERSDMLKQRLKLEMCTETFRDQVRCLRNELSIQLTQPTLLGGRPLTGLSMAAYVKEIANCLNQGKVVLPQNAYTSMIKQEVDNLYRRSFENLNTDIDNYFIVISKLAVSRDHSFPNENEVKHKFNDFFSSFQNQFDSELKLLIGDVPIALRREITKDIPQSPQLIDALKVKTESQFMTKYNAELHLFFAGFRNEGDRLLHNAIEDLKSDVSSVIACENSMQVQDFLWNKIKKFTEGLDRKWSSCSDWNNTLQSWKNIIELGSTVIFQIVKQKHEISKRAAEQLKDESRIVLEDFKIKLHGQFQAVLDNLDPKYPSGFPKNIAFDELNKKFKLMNNEMRLKLDRNPHCNSCLEDFRADAERCSDQFVSLYDAMRQDKFDRMAQQLMGEISKFSNAISLKNLHTYLPQKTAIDFSKFNEDDVSALLSNHFFQSHYYELVQSKKKLLNNWDDFDYYWSEMEEMSVIMAAQEKFAECKERVLSEFNANYQPVSVNQLPPQPPPASTAKSSKAGSASSSSSSVGSSRISAAKSPSAAKAPVGTSTTSSGDGGSNNALVLAAKQAREYMKRVHGIDNSASALSSSTSPAKKAKVSNEKVAVAAQPQAIKLNPHIEFLAREHEKAKIAMRNKGYKIQHNDDEDKIDMQVEGAGKKAGTPAKKGGGTPAKKGGGTR